MKRVKVDGVEDCKCGAEVQVFVDEDGKRSFYLHYDGYPKICTGQPNTREVTQ